MSLKWGICCAGNMCHDFACATYHLSKEKHELVAVAARKIEKAEAFAAKFGISKAYDSYQQLADDPDINIVYIGAMNKLHKELSLMMLNAGKHVLCELPFTLNTKESQEVYAKAKEKNLFCMEAMMSRFSPVYDKIRDILEKGEIGDTQLIQIEVGYDMKAEFGDAFNRKIDLGACTVQEFGILCIQLVSMVFGAEKPLNITSSAHKDAEGMDVVGVVTLLYTGNRVATFTYSILTNVKNNAVIYGTKGKLEIPNIFWNATELLLPDGTKFETELPHSEIKPIYENNEAVTYEVEAVRSCIEKGQKEHPYFTHSESILIMSIIDDIRKQLGITFPGE